MNFSFPYRLALVSSHIKRYLSLPDFLNWPLRGKIFTREWVVLSGPGSRLTQELSSEGVRGTRFHAGMYSGASAGGARWPWLRRAQGRGGWDHIGDDCRAPRQRAAKSVYVLGGGAQRKWVVWGSFTVSAAGVPLPPFTPWRERMSRGIFVVPSFAGLWDGEPQVKHFLPFSRSHPLFWRSWGLLSLPDILDLSQDAFHPRWLLSHCFGGLCAGTYYSHSLLTSRSTCLFLTCTNNFTVYSVLCLALSTYYTLETFPQRQRHIFFFSFIPSFPFCLPPFFSSVPSYFPSRMSKGFFPPLMSQKGRGEVKKLYDFF